MTIDVEVMDLAARLFDMARDGDAIGLAAYLDAGPTDYRATAVGVFLQVRL